ncbi:uncharacterized protein LOC114271148 [Camellia sinensis]|uniref:uncharacterized protein LOC114271148 n=1 Tax=Camellia sinensis TaxID=4442 RepID=UPI001035BC8D|nr:uncharacterized protein LOC114271148 [Camellia sinensis]
MINLLLLIAFRIMFSTLGKMVVSSCTIHLWLLKLKSQQVEISCNTMGNVPKRMQLTLFRRIKINLPSRKLEKMSSRNLEKMSCSEGFVDLVIEIDLKVTFLKGLRQELIGIDEQVSSTH